MKKPWIHPHFSVVPSLLASGMAATAPGAPQIDWMETHYSIIEINQTAKAYEQLFITKEHAEIPVSWSKWSGDAGTRVEYRINGEVAAEAPISRGATQSGSTALQVSQGGQYELTVARCDDTNCAESAPKSIVVADTDGSHLDPIQLNAGENNTAFNNTSDSIVGAYFVEWGIYGRGFPVDKIPAYNLTHILYGFIPICGGDGINDSFKTIKGSFAALQRSCSGRQDFKVAIHDPWAALQKPQQGHDFNTPYKGNFGQLMELKKAFPNLKLDVRVTPSMPAQESSLLTTIPAR